MSNYDNSVQTVSKVLRNKYNVIREAVNVYKCARCENTYAGKSRMRCPDKNCNGELLFFKRIPQSKIEEITSRRAAR
jgi:DNA-directed RNA polymerase subunit RPC12/RpoP